MSASSHSIRIANPTDAASVSHLLEESYRVLLPAYYDDAVMAQILPLISKANPLFAEFGDVLCGNGWPRQRGGLWRLEYQTTENRRKK